MITLTLTKVHRINARGGRKSTRTIYLREEKSTTTRQVKEKNKSFLPSMYAVRRIGFFLMLFALQPECNRIENFILYIVRSIQLILISKKKIMIRNLLID